MNNITAREVALLALSACEQQGAWSDSFLKKALRDGGLDSRDAALATRLCFGVLQNRMLLDWHLKKLSTMHLEKIETRVLCALRLGAYQILFLDRVPDSAAVNESVNLTRVYAKNPKASGLVNGVLRNLSRTKMQLELPDDLAIQYSHPAWLVEAFSARLDREGTRALLEANNGQPPTVAQVNTCRVTTQLAQKCLEEDGVEVLPHPWLQDCLILTETGNLERLQAFQQGYIYIQDPAAKLAVLAAAPKPGMRVLDACAAPGGKSFATAIAMGDMGAITACDIHPHKELLIQAGAARMGLNIIKTAVLDGKQCNETFVDAFDLVLADVPCSGLGIIRKKPDIRYKQPTPLENLPAVQGAILDNVSAYVNQGGVLLYATCTLLQRENETVVHEFLDRHNNFTLDSFQLPGPIGQVPEGMLTLWPHRHDTDGFFIAKLRRQS